MLQADVDINGTALGDHAILSQRALPAPGAEFILNTNAFSITPTLGLNCDGTTQCVQPIKRIGTRHQLHATNSEAWNLVPEGHIAKWLVYTHTIYIGRQTL